MGGISDERGIDHGTGAATNWLVAHWTDEGVTVTFPDKEQRSEWLRAARAAYDELKRQAAAWVTVAPILEAHHYEGTNWNAFTRWNRASQALVVAERLRRSEAAMPPPKPDPAEPDPAVIERAARAMHDREWPDVDWWMMMELAKEMWRARVRVALKVAGRLPS